MPLLAICHTFFAFLSLMGFTGMFEYSIPLLGSIGCISSFTLVTIR